MGLRDFFRRDDDDSKEPEQAGPDEGRRASHEGIEQAPTFIDRHGDRRLMPKAMRESLERALRASEGATGTTPGEEDDGDL